MAKDLVYRDDARKAVLRAAPSAAYCIDSLRVVDAMETVYADRLDAIEPVTVVLTKMCSRCKCHMLPQDHVCPGCGAIMREME